MKDLKDCDYVIESIVEDLDTKMKLYHDLDAIIGEDVILGTNTSTFFITHLGSEIKHRTSKFIGLHFFFPVPMMKLVEIVKGLDTS